MFFSETNYIFTKYIYYIYQKKLTRPKKSLFIRNVFAVKYVGDQVNKYNKYANRVIAKSKFTSVSVLVRNVSNISRKFRIYARL